MAETWNIVTLDRKISLDGKADVVTTVQFQVRDSETVGSGDDEIIYDACKYGFAELDISDLSSFTPYAEITEADAIAWAKAALGNDQVAAYAEMLKKEIEKLKNDGTGVPW